MVLLGGVFGASVEGLCVLLEAIVVDLVCCLGCLVRLAFWRFVVLSLLGLWFDVLCVGSWVFWLFGF